MLPTRSRQFQLGRLNVLLETITDSEALLDELIQRGPQDPDYQDEVMPYWADLWHSALGLGEYLTDHQQELNGKSVIELGCGLGLPGIVASLLGARVNFTDYVQDALDFARKNLELNRKDHEAAFQLLDWRNPPLDQQYELVLAADVAYEDRFFQPLYQCIHNLLAPGGECWLSEPGRPIAREFLRGFVANGFEVVAEDFKVARLDGVSRKIGILRVKAAEKG